MNDKTVFPKIKEGLQEGLSHTDAESLWAPIKRRMAWYEVSVALHLSGLRHTESLKKSLQDKHGYKGRDTQDNFYGVLGEMAFAKIVDVYYSMTVNTFKEADVGYTWQVRTVGSNKNRDLIIRPGDPIEHRYALVEIARDDKSYLATLHGWIEGINGMLDRYLDDFGYKDRPAVYRIKREDLVTNISTTKKEGVSLINELE